MASDILVNLAEEDLELRYQLEGKRLICEVPFDKELVETFRDALFENLETAWSYPSLAAVVTVGTGVYWYKTGNLWDSFPPLVSVSQRTSWGRRFERFLEDHSSLEAFRFLSEEGAHRYVAPILAHGGVPHTCLEDLFSLIAKRCTHDQNGPEALEYLRDNERLLRGVNRPVGRFICHGGETAEELLGRLLALWRSLERGDSGATFGLPQRIVDSFVQWYQDAPPSMRLGARHRFPSPFIRLDPRIMRINLCLPPCIDHPDAGQEWTALGRSWPSDLPVEAPLERRDEWDVRCGGRVFRFRGIGEASPVMFFDVPSGRFIRDPERRRLPEHVWALCRDDVQTHPEAVHREAFPQWDGFSIAAFALEDHEQLSVGGMSFDVRRPFFRLRPQPGVKCVVAARSGAPVLSAAPAVDWEGKANLHLVKDGSAQGNIDLTSKEYGLLVDGPGEYDIELRGPLGQNVQLGFLLIPGFSATASPEVRWPDRRPTTWSVAAPQAVISREDDSGATFQSEGNAIDLKVELLGCCFEVRATVPSLEWCLNVGGDTGQPGWSNRPLLVDLEELCSGGLVPVLSCRLTVELPDTWMSLEGGLSGHRLHGKNLSVQGEAFWHFNLGEVRDLLLATGQSERFDLVVTSSGSRTLYRGPILEVRPDWDLRNLTAAWTRQEDTYVVRICWSEQGREVRGRWVTIQSVWRPWEAPVLKDEVLPGVRGRLQWEVPCCRLRPGRYRVCAIHAPWGIVGDPRSCEPQGVCYMDVQPEIWPEVFSLDDTHTPAPEEYLEATLAHWYRPERAPLPRVPAGLSQSNIVSFLRLLEQADALEALRSTPDSGPLRIFCANPQATSAAVVEMADLPAVCKRALPPTELISAKIGGPDREFLFDLVLNWDRLRSRDVAAAVVRGHRPKALCEPLRMWRKALLATRKRDPEVPRLGDLVFLCEKFRVLRGRCADAQADYESLKSEFNSRETP